MTNLERGFFVSHIGVAASRKSSLPSQLIPRTTPRKGREGEKREEEREEGRREREREEKDREEEWKEKNT